LWLQQKHCAAARSLCSKGDITIELAGRWTDLHATPGAFSFYRLVEARATRAVYPSK
jgi:hypothetical protein